MPSIFAAAGLSGATLCSHVGPKTSSRYTFSSRSLTLEQHSNVSVSDPTKIIYVRLATYHHTPIIKPWPEKPSKPQRSQRPAGRRRLRKTQRKTSRSSHGRRCWAKHTTKGLEERIGSTCNCRIMYNAGVWLRDKG